MTSSAWLARCPYRKIWTMRKIWSGLGVRTVAPETSRSGVERPGVDAGESSNSDGGNGERGRRIATKRSMGDEDNGPEERFECI